MKVSLRSPSLFTMEETDWRGETAVMSFFEVTAADKDDEDEYIPLEESARFSLKPI